MTTVEFKLYESALPRKGFNSQSPLHYPVLLRIQALRFSRGVNLPIEISICLPKIPPNLKLKASFFFR